MTTFISSLVFVFGLILGSFYNVVGYRLPNGISIVYPPSHCPNCNKKITWYQNIPLLSYFFLKGKCHYCHQKISVIYPLVEFTTGLLFLTAYLKYDLTFRFIISIIIISLLMIITISDTKYLVINDSVLLGGFFLLLITTFLSFNIKYTIKSLLSGILMFLVIYALRLIGNHLFKKDTIGGGDIKLMFLIGFILGPLNSLLALFLSSFLAFPISLYNYLKHKENVIPFGPFLLLGTLIIYLFNLDLITIFNFLS